MGILKRVEAYDFVVLSWRIQVVVITDIHEAAVRNSKEAELIRRELGTLQLGRRPEHPGAITLCCVQHPGAPSATQIENSLSLLHSKFPANVIEHLGLCRLQVVVRSR